MLSLPSNRALISSTLPGLVLALVGCSIALSWHLYRDGRPDRNLPDQQFYSQFSTLVSFFLVLRSGYAIGRYMEAASILYRTMGDWFDAASSLASFCRPATASDEDVTNFLQVMIRLVSLLSSLSLADLEGSDNSGKRAFEYTVLDCSDLESVVLDDIRQSQCKPETVFQMLQALVVDNMSNGVLAVPPPILTRAIQELSTGMLNYHEAVKLVKVPYPVSYKLLSTMLLALHSCLTIRYHADWMSQWYHLLPATFVTIFSFWLIHGACEVMENPFHTTQPFTDSSNASALSSTTANTTKSATGGLPAAYLRVA